MGKYVQDVETAALLKLLRVEFAPSAR